MTYACERGREVTLFSRHKKVLNKRFPGVVDALASLDGDFVLDGEVVALDSQGRPSFQVLQNNLSRSRPVYFYCFDLLNREGRNLVNLPIERRRELLHKMFAAPVDPLRLSPLLHSPPGQILEAVRKLGLEGIVGKRIGSRYEPGERSGAWIKLRTNLEQQFVIGVTSPEHADSMHCSSEFILVAKVKNGFVPRIRVELLKPSRHCNCPVPLQESA